VVAAPQAPSRLAPQIKDANRRYVFTSPSLKCRTSTPLDDETKDGQPQAKEVRDTLVVHVKTLTLTLRSPTPNAAVAAIAP
jgi:hypothetical protein